MSVPQDLLDFYSTLIAGSNQKRKDNSKCMRQVKTYWEDVIYGVHNRKVKISKHIMLGMSLKSLTSSRKIIDIIHRLHCISYPGVEDLETEATYTSVQNSSICPETIVKSPLLCTGVAFDNFNRFVETNSGKDTFHDTVGIIYQNVELHTPNESQFVNLLAVNNEETVISKKRRRRTFEAITVDMQEKPVAKRKKNSMDLSSHYGEYSVPVNLQLYKTIDTVSMVSHALKLPNVSMWVGFNSSLICNDSLKQIVSYLTPINDSLNNKSVVLETIKQSKKICEEVKQSSIQVTYDLAIAKVALQIQATKKPDFDNLFIHLGAFHIMMASFKAVGKIIIDCGLTNVMVQSNLLACGSVSGFLEAKHLNRCKRLHPLMALAL
ncbi:hypothetical protein TNCV_3652391 [Trichonephila clavipes]|nr:hypothetical protein TNCV_3652391 [Trichonephila clavipes]